MYPILGRYGPFFLYSFTVIMALGLAGGLGLTAWLAHRGSRSYAGWLDALLVALLAAVVGGRAVFVWANWPYYQENPGEITLVWLGGLSYHGALIAGLLALGAWTTWRKQPIGRYADLLAPALALVSAFGWLACWFEGCAFGREAARGPLTADLPDSFGVFALRYQTQLMGLALSLVAFLLLLGLRGKMRSSQLFWLALLALSADRLIVGPFRGDVMPAVGMFRLDSLVEFGLVVCSLSALLITWTRAKKKERRMLT